MTPNRQRRIASGAVILVGSLIAGLFLIPVFNPEPLYNGRTAKEWARQLSNPGPRVAPKAYSAFQQTSPESLPFLIRAVELHPTAFDRAYQLFWRKALRKLPASLLQKLPPMTSNYDHVRLLAINSLSQMQSKAAPAIPVLLRALQRDPFTQRIVLAALQQIAPSDIRVIEAHKEQLSSPDLEMKLSAAGFLSKGNHFRDSVIPLLSETLLHTDPGNAWLAAVLLEQLEPAALETIPALIRTLQTHDNHRVRGKAAIVLGKIGPAAHQAVPALKAALNDEHYNVRDAASDALAQIKSRSSEN